MKLESIRQSTLLIALIIVCSRASSSPKAYFTGAVFEHARQADDSPETRVQINLDIYDRATKEAKAQGANLIVFPEYGIVQPEERNKTKQHLESIPNPKEVRATPCDEPEEYAERPILYTLSCMAKKNDIVLVANMGGIEHCNGERGCPDDGELHLNTNIAFDQNGTIIGRYCKERLFFETGMDLPRQKQDPTFETNFGRFAMFTSFDIIFRKMAQVSRFSELDAVLFPTFWVDLLPFYTSSQWFQAWSMGNNATLLAANIHMPGYLATGSGIFRGREGSVVSTFHPDGISKLIVATVPKRNQKISSTYNITAIAKNHTKTFEDSGKEVPSVCSYDILGKAESVYEHYRCVNDKVTNYTLVKLNKTQDYLRICNNGLCCELDYRAGKMNEDFYLGVFSGIYNSFNRYFWAEENCFLARCDDFNGTACSHFPTKSETLFHKVSLTANFASKHIYPSFISSGVKLVPVKSWTYRTKRNKRSIELHSYPGIPLLAATLKGRAYNKDPPYTR